MSSEAAPYIRYIILHKPGPAWAPGVDFREQHGVMEHVRHYRAVYDAGQLELGGPFLLPDMGGMMVPARALSREQVEQIARSDPAVKSGLLEAEVLPWYVAMSGSR